LFVKDFSLSLEMTKPDESPQPPSPSMPFPTVLNKNCCQLAAVALRSYKSNKSNIYMNERVLINPIIVVPASRAFSKPENQINV